MENELIVIRNEENKIKLANNPAMQLKAVNKDIETVYKSLNGRYNAEIYSKLNSLKADVKRLQTEIENKSSLLPYKNNVCLRDYTN